MKNPQFLSNFLDILPILPTNVIVIMTKFHKDWIKIVDFSLKKDFLDQSHFLFVSLYIFSVEKLNGRGLI